MQCVSEGLLKPSSKLVLYYIQQLCTDTAIGLRRGRCIHSESTSCTCILSSKKTPPLFLLLLLLLYSSPSLSHGTQKGGVIFAAASAHLGSFPVPYCVGQRPAPDRYLEHTCVQAEQSKQSAP